MSGLLPRKTLWTMVSLLLIAGAWLLGRHQGTQQALETAISQASDSISLRDSERILFLEQELARNANTLNASTRAIEAAEARSVVLEDALDESLKLSVDDAAELALYRRIATSTEPHTLAVEGVLWDESVPASIDLTLIQWRGRERVQGQVQISLGFAQSQSQSQNESGAAEQQSVLVEAIPPVEFDFRFFQKLTVPVDVALDAKPDFIEIRVKPGKSRLRALVKRIEWPDL